MKARFNADELRAGYSRRHSFALTKRELARMVAAKNRHAKKALKLLAALRQHLVAT